MNKVKCLIIGSGPAGYTAAIYAGRANLAPVLIEGPQLGGQLTSTTEVENFPGYPDGVDPFTMMDDMRRQAERFGTTFVSGIVTKVDFSVSPKKVWVEDTDLYEADAVIIATGASAKYLGIESERTYKGRGVSACATCDGFFYRKKTVAVVGGGDTACEEANYLAGLCEKVYMIVRKPFLRASEIMQQRVLNNPKIEVLFEHNTLQLTGDGKVQGADLIYRKGEPDEAMKHIDIDGFFLAQAPAFFAGFAFEFDIGFRLDKFRHPLAELAFDILERHRCVFNGIVQHSSGQELLVACHGRRNRHRFQRVHYVGETLPLAFDALVRLDRKNNCLIENRSIHTLNVYYLANNCLASQP